jgi:DNA-binding MarR family transcriptional regulator
VELQIFSEEAMTEEFTDALIAISRHFGILERDQVCCGEVTVPQCVALQHLRAAPCDVSSLASHLGTSVSATTRLVDGLERNEWLQRRADPDDGRRVQLCLTDSGREQADNLRRATEEMAAELLSHIPEARRDDVVRALGLLEEALSRSRLKCCG